MRGAASRWWRVAALAGLLGACVPVPAGDGGAAVAGLPACEPAPPATEAAVEGLVLPAGAVVTSVTPQDPLVTVSGYVPVTPVEVRREFEGRTDVEVLVIEDEVFESEVLVSDGTHRTYLRASALCATGSGLLAVVAPDAAAGALPVPPSASPA